MTGHEERISFFEGILQEGRLSHAYLFSGSPQSEKRAFLSWLLSALKPSETLVLKPEEHTHIVLDQMRSLLADISLSVPDGGMRAVIIQNGEDLMTGAANAFLKTLEEPPPRTIFFVLTQRVRMVLPTIISRCEHFRFPLPAHFFKQTSSLFEGMDKDLSLPLFQCTEALQEWKDEWDALEPWLHTVCVGGATEDEEKVLRIYHALRIRRSLEYGNILSSHALNSLFASYVSRV